MLLNKKPFSFQGLHIWLPAPYHQSDMVQECPHLTITFALTLTMRTIRCFVVADARALKANDDHEVSRDPGMLVSPVYSPAQMEKLPQLVNLSCFINAQTILKLVHSNIFDASPWPLPSPTCPEGQV